MVHEIIERCSIHLVKDTLRDEYYISMGYYIPYHDERIKEFNLYQKQKYFIKLLERDFISLRIGSKKIKTQIKKAQFYSELLRALEQEDRLDDFAPAKDL